MTILSRLNLDRLGYIYFVSRQTVSVETFLLSTANQDLKKEKKKSRIKTET